MNILITSGGTSEPVDPVRVISNTATGRLGSLTADCLAASGSVERIFYVCGRGAFRPQTALAEITEIGGGAELEEALRNLAGSRRIDAVIHSMAVSDYRLRTVSSAARIAAAFAESSGQNPAETLAALLEHPPALDQKGKIRSDEKNLILFLEAAPKIISLFGELTPQAILVGFKLLSGVSRQELIDAAFGLLQKNRCAFVLANDTAEMSAKTHTAYLVDQNKTVTRYESKAEIANGITEKVLAAYYTGEAVSK